MKTFTGMSNIAVRPDGLAMECDLDTSEGPTRLAIPIAQIPLIAQVLGFATSESGRIRALPTTFSPNEEVKASGIPSTDMALMPGPRQHVLVLHRVGSWDFAIEVPAEILRQRLEGFQQAAEMLASEPKSVQ